MESYIYEQQWMWPHLKTCDKMWCHYCKVRPTVTYFHVLFKYMKMQMRFENTFKRHLKYNLLELLISGVKIRQLKCLIHTPTRPCFQTNFCHWCTIIIGNLTVWAFRSDIIPNWEFPQSSCSAVCIQQLFKSFLLLNRWRASLFCSPDSATSLQLLFIVLILNCSLFPINQRWESEPETKELWCVCLA